MFVPTQLSQVSCDLSDDESVHDSFIFDNELAITTQCDRAPSTCEAAIFPGSPLGSEEFTVAFMQLCQNDLTKLLTLSHCSHPAPSCLPRSSYSLMKRFVDLKEECTIDRYCASCLKCLQPPVRIQHVQEVSLKAFEATDAR